MSLLLRAVNIAVMPAIRLLTRWRAGRCRSGPRDPARRSADVDELPFVGRVDLIRRILSTIHNNSILLRGEQGIGKTAILRQLEIELATNGGHEYEFHPVFVDLEGVPEGRLFITLADAVLEELDPDSLVKRREARQPGAPYGHRDLANELRRLLNRLGGHRGTQIRVVLLIDGIDRLESFHPRVSQRLRGLFMASLSDSLVMVASAVEISRRWERESSPWFNFFEEIEIGALTPGDAKRMIEVCCAGAMEVESEAVERILDLTECHPTRIRARCDQLIDRLRGQGRGTITAADVELVDSSESRRHATTATEPL